MTFRKAPRPSDPRPVGELLDGLAERPGWGEHLALGRLRERWAEVAGAVVAAHSEPVRIEDGALVIRAESGAWATELSLLGRVLAARAGTVLGAGSVGSVRVVSDPEPKRPGWGWKPAAQRGSRGSPRPGKKGL